MSEEQSSSPAEVAVQSETVTTDNGVATDTEVTYAGGKFKSVSALEKSYEELQSTFSRKTQEYNEALGGFSGAPEAYELPEGIEANDRISALQEWGKENNMNNDALNSLIEMDMAKTQAANEAYIQAQKEALGENADARLQNITEWANANGGSDVINGMITSAESVQFLESVMKKAVGGVPPATAETKPQLDEDTVNAMRFAIDKNSGERRMSIDPAYRAKVEALEEKLYASKNL